MKEFALLEPPTAVAPPGTVTIGAGHGLRAALRNHVTSGAWRGNAAWLGDG